jgi:hypothetical protein
MNRIFAIDRGFKVPDGTIVTPFLNSKDSESDLPWDLVEGFSISAGEIAPNSKSKIHIIPLVRQVTFVLSGKLKVCMKDIDTPATYILEVSENQAILTPPGTFLQYINCTTLLAALCTSSAHRTFSTWKRIKSFMMTPSASTKAGKHWQIRIGSRQDFEKQISLQSPDIRRLSELL